MNCPFIVDETKGSKTMGKTVRKDKQRDDTARIVAQIHGVSTSYVQKVRSGERENEDIMATLVDYAVGKNKLIRDLRSLIPLKKSNPQKHGRKKN